ncbi:hypothetical protein [Embleya sp. NBC_00896]|uniref:hypothetical protein n=1 Tax=Embleya sp. NBC_00896 TaxID=2975961 RepID=UPI002F915E15|nr:hypothetical protein OG928_39610 [Embleya sp. NBC_00896]
MFGTLYANPFVNLHGCAGGCAGGCAARTTDARSRVRPHGTTGGAAARSVEHTVCLAAEHSIDRATDLGTARAVDPTMDRATARAMDHALDRAVDLAMEHTLDGRVFMRDRGWVCAQIFQHAARTQRLCLIFWAFAVLL